MPVALVNLLKPLEATETHSTALAISNAMEGEIVAPERSTGLEVRQAPITTTDAIHLTAAANTLLDHGCDRRGVMAIMQRVWADNVIDLDDLRGVINQVASTYRYRQWSLGRKGSGIVNPVGWWIEALRDPRKYIRRSCKAEAATERQSRDQQRALERQSQKVGLILAPEVDPELEEENRSIYDVMDRLLSEVNEINKHR